jgi:UDP-3-O-[3-hydroxymyristoyl] glucosamine N-acyltransferase
MKVQLNVMREGKTLVFSDANGNVLLKHHMSTEKVTQKKLDLITNSQAATGQTFDFGDGKGPAPAHRHQNPNGSVGGWVADTATVATTVYVGVDARVFGGAQVYGNASVRGSARVFGNARVYDNAWVYGNAQVCGAARVGGEQILTEGLHT